MDSILILSKQDEKLQKFLGKIGYDVRTPAVEGSIKQFLEKNLVDIVVLDNDYDLDVADLSEFLRLSSSLNGIPIICVAKDESHAQEIKERGGEKVELLVGTPSIGALAARIATALRLHKLAGEDPTRATLAEMNAALRDLNERFKKELEQARGIQENLLPRKLPKSDKYDLTIVYKPLDEVGGDWYFINPDAEGKLSVQIADVTGHGLAAAFIGCMTKLALVAANCHQPSQLLSEMNRLMGPQLPQGTFVTLCSFLFDPASGGLQFARAGHPPALVIDRAGKCVKKLSSDGFPIGFLDGAEYALEETKLGSGDLLIAYTDGITEAQNRDSEQYGIDRLANAALATSASSTSEQVVKKILEDFGQFCDGRIIKDDITLIVLKRK